MKKFLESTLLRALVLLAFGGLLIAFAGEASTWIVRGCGILFIVPGLVAMISCFRSVPEERPLPLFPIVALGSILLGVIQIVHPELFIEMLRYILVGILLVATAFQLYSLWNILRGCSQLSSWNYLGPIVPLIIGLVILFYEPVRSDLAMCNLLTGAGLVAYALFELWTIVLTGRAKRLAAPEALSETAEEAQTTAE